MQLVLETAPAPGAAIRRPRRVASPQAESLNGKSVRAAEKAAGEGANHGGWSGRAPLCRSGTARGATPHKPPPSAPGILRGCIRDFYLRNNPALPRLLKIVVGVKSVSESILMQGTMNVA